MKPRHQSNPNGYTQWRTEFAQSYRRHHPTEPREDLVKLVWRNLKPPSNHPKYGEPVVEHHGSRVIDIISDNIVTVRCGAAEFQCLVTRGRDRRLHLVHSLS